jgi:hypothetical protein
VSNLLGKHMARANWANTLLTLLLPNRKNQKHVPTRRRLSNFLKPGFRRRTCGLNHNRTKKEGLDFFHRDNVLLAFVWSPTGGRAAPLQNGPRIFAADRCRVGNWSQTLASADTVARS